MEQNWREEVRREEPTFLQSLHRCQLLDQLRAGVFESAVILAVKGIVL